MKPLEGYSILAHISNANGELTHLEDFIKDAVEEVVPIVQKELGAEKIDIHFAAAPERTIPEYGLGGYSPGPNNLYISLDPASDKITKQGLLGTLFHEIHHCARWGNPGYGTKLGEALVSEGLACLYEAEHGAVPLYAAVALRAIDIANAQKKLAAKAYNHAEWFFGSKQIPRWFGYSYGYIVCREYSAKSGKKASELVSVDAKDILTGVKPAIIGI